MADRKTDQWIVFGVIGAAILVGLLVVCAAGVLLLGLLGVSLSMPLSSRSMPLPTPTLYQPVSTPTPLPATPTPTTEPTQEATAAAEATATDSNVPEALIDQMEAVEPRVADLRGLPYLSPVPKAFMTPEELSARVQDDFLSEYSEQDAEEDTSIYVAFGLIPEDFELLDFYRSMYSELVAGFYDPEEDQIFVISENTSLSASDEWTYSHEIVHALQDQHFDLETFLHYEDEEWHLAHPDEAMALSAFIEGDATFTSQLYLEQYFSPERWNDLIAEYEAMEEPEMLSTAPSALLEEFYFPYTYGLAFIEELYEAGGFDRIDQAYVDPPTTTEHILHPERYLNRDAPTGVDVENGLLVLDDRYGEVRVQPIGEFTLLLYLSNRIDLSAAKQAAAGWDGGEFAVYEAGEDQVLVMRTAWDNSAEAREFFAAIGDYAAALPSSPLDSAQERACWQGESVLCVMQLSSTDVLIVQAPVQDEAASILDQYQP